MAYNRGGNGQGNYQNRGNSGGSGGGRGGNRGGNSSRAKLNYIYAANFTKDLKFENQQAFDAWLNEQYALLDSLKFDPKMRVQLSFDGTEEVSINIAPKDIDAFFQDAEKAAGDQNGDGGLRMVIYSSRRSNQSTGEEYDGASLVFQPKFNNQKNGGRGGNKSFGGGGRGNNGRRDYPDQNQGGGDSGNGQEQSSRGAGNRTTRGSQEQRQSRTNSQQERGEQTNDGSHGGQQEQSGTTSHSNDNGSYTNQEW